MTGDLYMIHPDVVATLQSMEPKLPLIYRKDIREAVKEIVSLRSRLEAALAAARDPTVPVFNGSTDFT